MRAEPSLPRATMAALAVSPTVVSRVGRRLAPTPPSLQFVQGARIEPAVRSMPGRKRKLIANAS